MAAIIRTLLLRRATFSLHRPRHLSSAAVAPPKTVSPPLWNRTAVRQKSKVYEEMFEDSISTPSNRSGVLEDYKFAYEEFKPRELDITVIEGCDLNHWLITVDFPKEPRPSPEEMVRFYEETVSKTLDLSLDDAKKKIYACSTSNYTGFHIEVTEEESEKFRGKPGVVFILPDSYVDKEKKEYGGDKYINGVIIPRPRPGMTGRTTRLEPRKIKLDEPVPAQRPNEKEQAVTEPNQLRIPLNTQPQRSPPTNPTPPNQVPPSYPPLPVNYHPPSLNNPPSPQNYGPPNIRPPQPNFALAPQNSGPPAHRAPPPPQPNYGPPSYPMPPQNYGPPMAIPVVWVPYPSSSFVPFQENFNRGWAWSFAPSYGPNPGPHWQGYGPQYHQPQSHWQGQPGQNYGPPQPYPGPHYPHHGGDYGPQQEQQDGGYQGQGPPPVGYWR